jgi:hypothetical protein
MFQYAMGRSLALRSNGSLKLDATNYGEYPDRAFELNRFSVRARLASRADLQRCKGYGLLGRFVAPKLGKLFPSLAIRVVREQRAGYDESVLEARGGVYLIGYWQSEKYFSEFAKEIRAELALAVDLDGPDATLADRIRGEESVALHVRRADYVSDPIASAALGPLEADYYRSAISLVEAGIPRPHFFVFSDDPDWAKTHLRFDRPVTFVTHNGPGRGAFDMRLMSLCRHQIVANSTFSWWSAWLNPNPAKLVVAPARWYRDRSRDSSDLVPAAWTRV